jgi:VWFA-related protein
MATIVPAAQAPQSKPPQFKSVTDLVSTPVIVRDSRGNFVPNLTMDDFEIFEDGVRQKPTTFVRIIGGQVIRGASSSNARRQEGLVLPPSLPADSGRVVIIFVDDLHFLAGDSIHARRALQQVRDVLLKDGDLVGFVSSGPSSIQGPMVYGYSRARFDQIINRVMGNGMTFEEIIAANQTREGPAQLRHNAHVAFRTAHDMLGQIANIVDRRKVFVYLSSGYDLNPYTDSRLKAAQDASVDPDKSRGFNPFEVSGQFSEAELIAELVELTQAAQRANVAFYPIDPRGLVAGPPINTTLQVAEFQRQLATSVSSLKVLANETGGICVCETNDIAGALRRIDNATSDYYLIGYTSSNADPKRMKRRIEIRLKRGGLEAADYKREYVIKRGPVD